MLTYALISGFAIVSVALIGVISLHSVAGRFLERRLTSFVSVSAGVFLTLSLTMMYEIVEESGSLSFVLLVILLGYSGAWLLHHMLPETHHHHDPSCHHHHAGAKKVLVGDFFHNIADGFVLITAYIASIPLGIAVTASIIVHETLQELSEFFILKQAGYSTVRALSMNALIASSVFIGVFGGYFLIDSLEIELLLLGIGAGFFLHVVLHDLLPGRLHPLSSAHDWKQHIALVLLGALCMLLLSLFVQDMHVHGGVYDHEEEYEAEDAHQHNDVLHDEGRYSERGIEEHAHDYEHTHDEHEHENHF